MNKIKNMFSKIKCILDHRQKMELLGVLFVVFFTTIIELVGVTAILPFINIILDSSVIQSNKYLKKIYDIGNFNSDVDFLIFIAIVLIVIYVIKNLLLIKSYDLQYKFTFNNQKIMASKMLKSYLEQPYLFHLNHSSAELIRSINTDIVMMYQGIIALLGLVAEMLVCIVLGIFLLFKDPMITLVVVGSLFLMIVIFAKKMKNYLSRIGEEDRTYSLGIVKWLQQSFGGLKETKIMHREKFFQSNFDEQYNKWADLERIYRDLQLIPKPIMETICISAILVAIIIKLSMGTDAVSFISSISVFAIAAFRLLPSFNRISTYINAILFYYPAFDAVYNDLAQIGDVLDRPSEDSRNIVALGFEDTINIDKLSFKYPTADDYVINNASFSIPKNKTVAFIGPSGAGKTTLADIILGVLEPSDGHIMVDGIDIFRDIESWQKNVGYIPQTIYLMDDTIKNNIVFGSEYEVDEERLQNAIKEAQLDEFVDSLKDGLDTEIGESGMRLSGGQRQRIGIARALYNNPNVLVLDEATSALDNDTEKAVMDAINSLAGSKTLIIIAHRLSTVSGCDIKYEVKDGTVRTVDDAYFNELLNSQVNQVKD
ncbi:ABC transporter ATP-binding protein [Butyrivibrio fibrisolvens]|uniref:ABC transporter ATP-binding protein n=1 Tax=Butyrivibrio fibrisolvens TaxID=831 RepID=UPI00040E6F66|nr:ATP-binding cassette domain-containing protein [Butyrivibrio fibrisolvens]